MKNFILILSFAVFFSINTYAKDNISSINIIEQIQKNLIYNKDVQKKPAGDSITIQKGGWTAKDTKELETATEKKMTASINVTKDDKRIITLKRQAYGAMQIGQTEIAINLYRDILKQKKDDNYAKLGLAIAYQQLGEYKQAKPLYLELLNKFPKDEQIVSNLLSIVIEETPYEATYLLSSLAQQNPTSPLIQAQTSLAYGNIAEYDKAIVYLKKSMDLDPQNIQYRYNLAVLYDLANRPNEAHHLYKQVTTEAKIDKTKMSQIPYGQIQDRIATIEKFL
jgi:Flp pilus assembly protein TadD